MRALAGRRGWEDKNEMDRKESGGEVWIGLICLTIATSSELF